MAVTDHQVSTLRSLLAKDFETHAQLLEQLDAEGRKGYIALVAAGFLEAVERRFKADVSANVVVEFVADVRSRSDEARISIDPNVAERMIRAVFDDSSIADIDDSTVRRTQGWILGALIYDEQLDDAALDEFMAEIRNVADHWTR